MEGEKMVTYEKIDDYTVKIIEEKTYETRVSIKELNRKKKELEDALVNCQGKLDKVIADITEAEALGVKETIEIER